MAEPATFPPLRVSVDHGINRLRARKTEGEHLFDHDKRFTHEMQERFWAWLKTVEDELDEFFWGEEVSKWFREGNLWKSNGSDAIRETHADRMKILEQIIERLEGQRPVVPRLADGEFEYDVCLSFAGEQREYVEQVAEALKDQVRVFYDRYEQANLWGKDLYEHLNEVYRDKARYCILFISREYAEKQWTTHERKGAQARAFRENREYILPVRFDDTDLPGMNETIGYIDGRSHSPEQVARYMLEKIRTDRGELIVQPPPGRAPMPKGTNDNPMNLEEVSLQVAIHIYENDPDGIQPHAADLTTLQNELKMSHDELDLAKAELEEKRLVKYHFYAPRGALMPTERLPLALGSRLDFDPTADDLHVARTLADHGEQVGGKKLEELTALSTKRLNYAIRRLEKAGRIDVRSALGTAPYTFRYAKASPKTTLFLKRQR